MNSATSIHSLPAFLEIKNGSKVKRTFSSSEMLRRIDALRRFMAETGVDAILLTSMHNVHYYSDFLYCAFGRDFGLVVTQRSSTTISPAIDFGQPYRRSFGDNLVYTDPGDENFFQAVSHLLGQSRTIGIEFDHVTVESLEKLKAACPKARFLDVGNHVMRTRQIKSQEEIELIRTGAKIAVKGAEAACRAIADGVPEHEAAQASTNAMIIEIACHLPHLELRDTWTWLQSGIHTDGPHNPVTSRRIRRGDLLCMSCFPMIAGYNVALGRTLSMGVPSERGLKIWECNQAVRRKGLELIRPGARCCDIAAELDALYAEAGLLEHRGPDHGRSFGIVNRYYGRETGIELRADVTAELRSGMVVSLEPSVVIPQQMEGAGGYREQDLLVVTENGAENMTDFPAGPEHHILGASHGRRSSATA
ncbi:aminopeptidase P family protein [uncultured Pseudodesulfovibrio sp.]|uniref:aminopeptidase P family protein n=1 Tax=uncultured Pseudodesulfovibrio sp. TaxID=2035858 RepID=UPI0029C98713|nr:aminopeptidase P family protein [uncultured Pseudodesulfovibrio sp.]